MRIFIMHAKCSQACSWAVVTKNNEDAALEENISHCLAKAMTVTTGQTAGKCDVVLLGCSAEIMVLLNA
jgi:hypothetical protein